MTRIPLEEPERWTERGPGSTLEDRLGVALRAAADASLAHLPTFDLRTAPPAVASTAAAPRRRRWLLPALGAMTLTLGGAVSAAQAIRAARLAAFTRVEVPRGSTVAFANGRHRKMNLVGPIAISGDVDRISISGEGQAHIEAGEQPLDILPPAGAAVVQLAPGTSWPPIAPAHEPALPGPAGLAPAARPESESSASASRPLRAAPEGSTTTLVPLPRQAAMLEPPAFTRPATVAPSVSSPGLPNRP
ncbi:MAG TPA: hypothetical protein VLA79_10595, partial [Polyangia bacterium]|nr:hypothetical protein [Polyangia bacterium]